MPFAKRQPSSLWNANKASCKLDGMPKYHEGDTIARHYYIQDIVTYGGFRITSIALAIRDFASAAGRDENNINHLKWLERGFIAELDYFLAVAAVSGSWGRAQAVLCPPLEAFGSHLLHIGRGDVDHIPLEAEHWQNLPEVMEAWLPPVTFAYNWWQKSTQEYGPAEIIGRRNIAVAMNDFETQLEVVYKHVRRIDDKWASDSSWKTRPSYLLPVTQYPKHLFLLQLLTLDWEEVTEQGDVKEFLDFERGKLSEKEVLHWELWRTAIHAIEEKELATGVSNPQLGGGEMEDQEQDEAVGENEGNKEGEGGTYASPVLPSSTSLDFLEPNLDFLDTVPLLPVSSPPIDLNFLAAMPSYPSTPPRDTPSLDLHFLNAIPAHPASPSSINLDFLATIPGEVSTPPKSRPSVLGGSNFIPAPLREFSLTPIFPPAFETHLSLDATDQELIDGETFWGSALPPADWPLLPVDSGLTLDFLLLGIEVTRESCR
ncbi:hypothetical protein BJ165DRAFT_1528687 [Panaeolus papilionaceus]|nr:hypothetical protein BJ165DRAFT_1528687 [Panaeolus papilionaceus]